MKVRENAREVAAATNNGSALKDWTMRFPKDTESETERVKEVSGG